MDLFTRRNEALPDEEVVALRSTAHWKVLGAELVQRDVVGPFQQERLTGRSILTVSRVDVRSVYLGCRRKRRQSRGERKGRSRKSE